MDAGQRCSWERTIPAVRGEDRGIYGRTGTPAHAVTVAGEVWSSGPYPSSWWAVADGERMPVVIRKAGKRDVLEAGSLYEVIL
jgi:hypothetical protein